MEEGFLTFVGPCIANKFAQYNQNNVTFVIFYISVRRCTCFRGFSVHHQELKTAHTRSGICQTNAASPSRLAAGSSIGLKFA